MNARTLLACCAIAAVSACNPAFAHPPADVPIDPAIHEWFEGLKIPGTGLSCCSEADCRPVSVRPSSTPALGQYQVFIDSKQFRDGPDAWVPVPDNKIIRNKPNPTGLVQACWTQWGGVLCLILASEA